MTIYEDLLNKYGHRLTLVECSQILKKPLGTLRNLRSQKTLEFKTYRDGRTVFANTLDVAQYLESKQQN